MPINMDDWDPPEVQDEPKMADLVGNVLAFLGVSGPVDYTS